MARQHPWDEDAGRRLAALREAKGWSQGVLGKEAGALRESGEPLHRNTVGNLEKGKAGEAETLELLSRALGVSVASLLPADSPEARAYVEGMRDAVERVGETFTQSMRELEAFIREREDEERRRAMDRLVSAPGGARGVEPPGS